MLKQIYRALIPCLMLTATANVGAQEWTRFRGPNGSGLSSATTVPVKWTDEDYNWKIDLPGIGHSSPIAWGDRLFVTSGDEETADRFVLCIDRESGKTVWTRRFSTKTYRKHTDNSFASGTPAVDAKRLYLCWSDPDGFVVAAVDHSGRDLWKRTLAPFKSGHGDGVSVVVHQGLVVVPNEHNGQSMLVALDAATGETRWQFPRDSRAHWSTPCVLKRQGSGDEFIFTNWKSGITAIDAATGKPSWQADIFDKGHAESSISSPIVAGGIVLGTSGWMGVRKEVIAVRPRLEGQAVVADKLYCIDRSAPLCTTPLVKDDMLFLWADDGVVTCADVASGEIHWRKRVGGRFYSSPICVGDHLFGVSTKGEVVVLAASKEYQELARNQLGEATHSTPAVVGGVLYPRTFSRLFSVGGAPAAE